MTIHTPKDPGFEALVTALQTYFDGLITATPRGCGMSFIPRLSMPAPAKEA